MPEDYLYDVFISYRHKQPVLGWVTYNFKPLLEQWLPNFMPYDHETRIFIDSQIETGAEWPATLRRALIKSRCLLAIWSPEYFRSKWCEAELQSILLREQMLGLRTEEHPNGLIYAVLFAGAGCLPSKVQAIQYKDLSRWNYPYASFRKNPQFLFFDRKVQQMCRELAIMIQSAPPWQENWPVVTPEVSPSITFALPRLR